jgi:hypothetical protein
LPAKNTISLYDTCIMTTEIAILNQSAIALAADSAVTLTSSDGSSESRKTYNSANKLFTLSKYEPIGLMIYGNATLAGIPWEPIIKKYREQLSGDYFVELEDYCTDFFDFVQTHICSLDLEILYVRDVALDAISIIHPIAQEWVQEELQRSPDGIHRKDLTNKYNEIVTGLVNHVIRWVKESKNHTQLTNTKLSSYTKKYMNAILASINSKFQDGILSDETIAKFAILVFYLSKTNYCSESIGKPKGSGIVIAGYGVNDMFPSCYNHKVYGAFDGNLLFDRIDSSIISHTARAIIIPFAQSHDVVTFMDGIAPNINHFIRQLFGEIYGEQLASLLTDELSTNKFIKKNKSGAASDLVRQACIHMRDLAFTEIEKFQRSVSSLPIIQTTAFLNKSEMSTMAETLVNLVSFRKQVAGQESTVGGPIDVAIISKGDGFVWVKRKHYFPANLNHQFFANYHLGRDSDGRS